MWASKLGLATPDAALVNELLELMLRSQADYTIFFRRLSEIPEEPSALQQAFFSLRPSAAALSVQEVKLAEFRRMIEAEEGPLKPIFGAFMRLGGCTCVLHLPPVAPVVWGCSFLIKKPAGPPPSPRRPLLPAPLPARPPARLEPRDGHV